MRKRTVVHCDTESKAIELLKWAESVGIHWPGGGGSKGCNSWWYHEENTCYDLFDSTFSDEYFYKYEDGKDYNILKYEDVVGVIKNDKI